MVEILFLVTMTGWLFVILNGFKRSARQLVASEVKAVEAKPLEDCAVFLARIFEERLVDAGIISKSDMSTCEDTDCQNCKSTRRELMVKQNAEALSLDKPHKRWYDDVYSWEYDRPIHRYGRGICDCYKCRKTVYR